MKKLNDFQTNNQKRTSISDAISIEPEERSLSENSNSLEDESVDESINNFSSDKSNQMTVKVMEENERNFS